MARGDLVAHISAIRRNKGTFAMGVGNGEGKGKILGKIYIWKKRERYNVSLDTYSLFCFLNLNLMGS